jgi:hypothetical protein
LYYKPHTQKAAMTDPKNPPVTLRLDSEWRQALDQLASNSSASEVLRRGLRMVASEHAMPGAPMYPRLVDDADVEAAVEEATRAACEVLDSLFPAGTRPESRGISSNFQGTLKEHLLAMLTGKPGASWSHDRQIPALFGDWRALGRLSRSAGAQEGYGVVQLPGRQGDEALYFDSDHNRFVPLAELDPGTLFTSSELAVKAAFAWMETNTLSPRACSLKLCLVRFADDSSLEMTALAC